MIFRNGLYLGREIYAFSNDWLIIESERNEFILFDSHHPSVIRSHQHDRLPINSLTRGMGIVEYYPTFDCAIGGLFMVLLEPVGFKRLPHYFDANGFDKIFTCIKCKKQYSVFLFTYMKNTGAVCENCNTRGSSPVYGGDPFYQH